jgi:hypothetical protein
MYHHTSAYVKLAWYEDTPVFRLSFLVRDKEVTCYFGHLMFIKPSKTLRGLAYLATWEIGRFSYWLLELCVR